MGAARQAEPNESLRRQRLQRGWTLDRVAEELDRLCEQEGRHAGVTGNMVGKWERGIKRPSLFYQERLRTLYTVPAEQLGFLGPQPTSPPTETSDRAALEALLASGGGAMERRSFLRHLVAGTAGTAALGATRWDTLYSEPWERLSKALKHPGLVDATTVADLEAITAKQHRLEERVPARRMLGGVVEHLHTLTQLLEASQTAPLRRRLATTAGELAALAGWLCYDQNAHNEARAYYDVAAEAAKEAGDRPLAACVLAYMSFMASSAGNPREASELLAQAHAAVGGNATATARAWLAGLEAEALAKLGDTAAALAAIERADSAFDATMPEADPCWIRFFDRGRLQGLKCSAYLHLRRAADAERASEEGLVVLSPTATKKRSIILADLAAAQVLQRNLDRGCSLAIEAVEIVSETESRVGLERVETFRRLVEPWRDSKPVRQLDERLAAARAGRA